MTFGFFFACIRKLILVMQQWNKKLCLVKLTNINTDTIDVCMIIQGELGEICQGWKFGLMSLQRRLNSVGIFSLDESWNYIYTFKLTVIYELITTTRRREDRFVARLPCLTLELVHVPVYKLHWVNLHDVVGLASSISVNTKILNLCILWMLDLFHSIT